MIALGLSASAVIVLLAFVTHVGTYRFAPVFLLPVVWGLYYLRDKLHLHPLHYALFLIAILLHMLGALGWYQQWPGPFSYDILVHAYFGFAGTFVLFRAFEHHYGFLKPWQLRMLTVMFIMGAGALHEIVEYGSYLALGEKGMLKESGYRFDTSRDLLDNFIGCLVALAVYAIYRKTSRRARDTRGEPVPT